MRIKNNISALNAQIALTLNESKLTKDLEKLTSGYRINRSGDDAAGLAISEQMRSQIAGLAQGELNAKDGLGLLRTGEGAMQEIHAMLCQMNTLALRSANGVYTDEGHREFVQEEVDRISEEIDRIASATRFNYVNLFHDDASIAADSGLTAPGLSQPGTISLDGANAAAATKTANKVQTKMIDDAAHMPGAGSLDETDAATATQITNEVQQKMADAAARIPGASVNDSTEAEAIKEVNTSYSSLADPVKKAIGDSGNAKAVQLCQQDLPGSPSKQASAGADLLTAALFSSDPSTPKATPDTASISTKAASSAANNNKIVFQIGPDPNHTISIPQFYLSKAALGLDKFDVSTQEAAQESINKVNDMVNYVSLIRGAYGAADNALEHAMNSMNIYKENLTAAESRIRDTDMAKELTERMKDTILVQTTQAMLAQANALPESTLSLLQ